MLKKIESKVNIILSKTPIFKKMIKRTYQLTMYSISPKIKSEGNINRISPSDGLEYFFGYYDKSPWDASDRFMLCLRAKDTYSSVAPQEPADIILFDTKNNNSLKVIGQTRAWNVQQGSMLQWLGPDYSSKIIYNDFRDGKYCSVIKNIETSEETVVNMPIYSVSTDGKFALSLDFSRLHNLRKGYGYSNLPEVTEGEYCPDNYCIWKINLDDMSIKPLLKYTDFADFENRHEMNDAIHKVNHIMLSPNGKRFMVLHRWLNGTKKYTRLVTMDIDGKNMFNLNDDNMTSHCWWKSDTEIVSFARKKNYGDGYFLFKDLSNNHQHLWPELILDGHPSYSPNKKLVVTDTYPNRSRISKVYLINNGNATVIAQVFSPFKYDNEVRCDLHPRWNRTGDQICIDSVFEGRRGLYVINVTKK